MGQECEEASWAGASSSRRVWTSEGVTKSPTKSGVSAERSGRQGVTAHPSHPLFPTGPNPTSPQTHTRTPLSSGVPGGGVSSHCNLPG